MLSKLLEKPTLQGFRLILEGRTLIPKISVGFLNKHGTVGQVYRAVNQTTNDLENKNLFHTIHGRQLDTVPWTVESADSGTS